MRKIERNLTIAIGTILIVIAVLLITPLLAYVPYEPPCSKYCELCVDDGKESACE